MKGSKGLGRRTGNLGRRSGSKFCSKTGDEGFKEFGKEKGSNGFGMKGSKEFEKESGSKVLVKDLG